MKFPEFVAKWAIGGLSPWPRMWLEAIVRMISWVLPDQHKDMVAGGMMNMAKVDQEKVGSGDSKSAGMSDWGLEIVKQSAEMVKLSTPW